MEAITLIVRDATNNTNNTIPIVSEGVTDGLIVAFCVIGLLYALFRAFEVTRIKLDPQEYERQPMLPINSEDQASAPTEQIVAKVAEISDAISTGAKSFLYSEYKILAIFLVVFSVILLLADGLTNGWLVGGFTAISFVVGGVTSIVSGFIGMRIAVAANGRTALKAYEGYPEAFKTAFKAGTVMGFGLVSLGLIVLFILLHIFNAVFADKQHMFEAIAGYGLGGSSIALFGRVGGGIYTKAADVGADLVGKVEQGIPEDDPRNPAVIADNVGDNVGDIAGMGADLFGSLAESTCAALVVASTTSGGLSVYWTYKMFPLMITAFGIPVGLLTSLLAANFMKVTKAADIERQLKYQLVVSTVLMTPAMCGVAYGWLPLEAFYVTAPDAVLVVQTTWWKVFLCAAAGLWAGLLIGFVTEYFTSHSYTPVRDVAESCKTGAATNIIYGLALGYKSTIIPVIALAIVIFISFSLADMYGIAVAALGILSTLTIGLTIDAYGPISDNAGGIAEMAGMGSHVRDRTDALDAAGNTTAAIGKGFAIGSAALVSLALFGAYVTKANIVAVNILQPFQFFGLLVGSMLPYWFSAMTMKSVGKAALAMVEEVRRQFREIPGLMEGEAKPEYAKCVAISTQASLREMLAPGALVMFTPLVVGFLIGVDALSGVLAGALVSGVQMAISASNTGGAWDNAKKYIETGMFGGKKSEPHHAAVVGDTVGDPLKDTSGPSLNILIKLIDRKSVV